MSQPCGVYLRNARLIKHSKNNDTHHLITTKEINHMLISINAEKHRTKINYPSKITTLRKLEIEENILNLIKGIYKKL